MAWGRESPPCAVTGRDLQNQPKSVQIKGARPSKPGGISLLRPETVVTGGDNVSVICVGSVLVVHEGSNGNHEGHEGYDDPSNCQAITHPRGQSHRRCLSVDLQRRLGRGRSSASLAPSRRSRSALCQRSGARSPRASEIHNTLYSWPSLFCFFIGSPTTWSYCIRQSFC